jgi:hypothetical protein
MKIKKSTLRVAANEYGKATIINIARGKCDNKLEGIKDSEAQDFVNCFKYILGLKPEEDLSKQSVNELNEILEPDGLLERFAAKKANKVGKNNEFLSIKG